MVLYFFFFFFKQKTAYEMRISDWSSDVCSSDLRAQLEAQLAVQSLRENFMAAAMMTLLTALGSGYLALHQHRAGAVRKRVASFALVAGVSGLAAIVTWATRPVPEDIDEHVQIDLVEGDSDAADPPSPESEGMLLCQIIHYRSLVRGERGADVEYEGGGG